MLICQHIIRHDFFQPPLLTCFLDSTYFKEQAWIFTSLLTECKNVYLHWNLSYVSCDLNWSGETIEKNKRHIFWICTQSIYLPLKQSYIFQVHTIKTQMNLVAVFFCADWTVRAVMNFFAILLRYPALKILINIKVRELSILY